MAYAVITSPGFTVVPARPFASIRTMAGPPICHFSVRPPVDGLVPLHPDHQQYAVISEGVLRVRSGWKIPGTARIPVRVNPNLVILVMAASALKFLLAQDLTHV
jgi:hypothetical protein